MIPESKSSTASDSSDLDQPQFSTSSDSSSHSLDGDQLTTIITTLQPDGSIRRANSSGDFSNNTNTTNGKITPPPTPNNETSIGAQIQSAFTPVTQAFARLSTLASESPLVSSLKGSNSNSSSVNNGPFWKRKGKVGVLVLV